MAPKGAKIWNEDLVLALRAREEMAVQQGKQRQYLFRDGANVLEGVRSDIYMFKTGRLVGLPSSKLKKTVDDLCRKIISGQEPVLPDGYAPSNHDEQRHFGGGNPFENHPYVNRIKIRGGAFAVLMAFHICGDQRQSMNKDQIIRAAQPFCDEAMEGNFHAGRPIGAWKGHETLVKHGFLHVQRAPVAYNERAGGLRSMGKNSYSLTREGEQFTEALFNRHPDVRNQLGRHDNGGGSAGDPMTGSLPMDEMMSMGLPVGGGGFGTAAAGFGTSRPVTGKSQGDRQRLTDWVRSTNEVGASIVFDVGKDRRKQLHDACDELTQTELRSRGLRLDHASSGTSRDRALKITMLRSAAAAVHNPYASPSKPPAAAFETPDLNLSDPFHVVSASSPQDSSPAFFGSGKALSTAQRAPTAREAAATAAEHRRALFESLRPQKSKKPAQQKPAASKAIAAAPTSCVAAAASPVVIDLSTPPNIVSTAKKEADAKPPAKSKRRLNFEAEVLEISDSDDDDDDDDELLCEGLSRSKKGTLSVGAAVELPTVGDGVSLSILIDNRERNRNCTPRFLRTELSRLLSSGPIASAWPQTIPHPQVEEAMLLHGDFNFVRTSSNNPQSTLPVMVERKRIGDLVQRSAARDHWGQLQRMRDRSALSVLLLEGDFRTAAAFVAFGAPEEWRKMDHCIDDEHSLLRFVGRAILSSNMIRFIQTKDEQESLRAVAALGVVTMASRQTQSQNPYSQNSRSTLLADRLKAGGIPWEIAKDLTKEIGSSMQLDALYGGVSDEECRQLLLAPLIEDSCQQIRSGSSPHSWSRAIHSVYFTTHSDPNDVRHRFNEYEHFVTNPAELLGRLHCGETPEEAVSGTFASEKKTTTSRVVEIQLPHRLKDIFDGNGDSFYSTTKSFRNDLVVMQTKDSKFKSDALNIFLFEGTEIAEKVRKAMVKKSTCYGASQAVAEQIHQECKAMGSRRIVLIRGLRPALEHLAKQPGYRQETRFVVDLVLSHLMVSHDIVVLQAVRKGDSRKDNDIEKDQTKILKAMALACFHFQLLTMKQV